MMDVVPLLAAQTSPDAGGGLMSILVMVVPMLVLMYFVMIRPEQKKAKEQAALLGALKRGDEVMLTSGFFGRIHAVDDKTVTLEIGDKQRVKVLKNAVMGPAQRFLGTSAPADDGKKAIEAPKEEKPS